jgi:hypothetical protein
LASRNARAGSSLQDSVDRLADAFDKMATRLDSIETNGGGGNGFGNSSDPVMRHFRRWMPFYALLAIFALFIFVIPTKPNGDTTQQAGALTQGGSNQDLGSLGDAGSASGDGTVASGTSAQGGSSGVDSSGVTNNEARPGTATTLADVEKFDPLAWTKTGKTRGGFDCAKGVRQLPWSRYAVPCYPAWSGNNGGATTRGVTAKEIVIVNRVFPETASSQATAAFVAAAGFASPDEFRATREKFVEYFNKTFELWGRKVKYIRYESEYGDSTNEALSKGKEEACADADSIISKYKPFAVIGAGATGVFGECSAERHMITFGAGAYYPENWYRKYNPWLFAGVMECERIAHMNAEYIGKRLANRPAKWSKDLILNKSKRVIGLIVPDNDQYSHCVNIAQKEGKEKYNADIASRYNYQLDIQRFPDEAANAIVQFKADNVTTIFLATDPLIPIFLTQYARGQEYFPEWIINSAGLTDVEQFARLWDQEEIQWSLFGMSQLGPPERILGPKGEGTTAYKKAFGTNIPPGTQTEYYQDLGLFTILQATGPVLTPQNMAATYPRLPPGGAPEYEVGYSSFATSPTGGPGYDHTGVDDMREVYWLCTDFSGDAGGTSRCNAPKAYDGKGGTYVSTYGGKRFRPGQFPTGDPPVFKEKP